MDLIACLYQARAFRDGIGVKKNYPEAKRLMRIVAYSGVIQAKYELIDLLMMSNSESEIKEAVTLTSNLTASGDFEGLLRLARMYIRGYYFRRDVFEAKRLMLYVYESGLKKALYELFDLLSKNINEYDNNDAKYILTTLEKNKNDPQSQLCLGRAYRDGSLIAPNIEQAKEYLRLASSKITSAKYELIELLLKSDNVIEQKEAFSLSSDLERCNNSYGFLYLAEIYHHSIGTTFDYGKAKHYYSKAISNGIKRARYELIDLLAMSDNEEDQIALKKLFIEESCAEIDFRRWLYQYKNVGNVQKCSVRKKTDYMIISSKEYLKYASVLMISVCINDKNSEKNFYVLENESDRDTEIKVTNEVETVGGKVIFVKMDDSLFSGLHNSSLCWPKSVHAKLIPHYFLPDTIEKILYLDIDTIVDGDISQLFDVDLGTNMLMGASSSIFFNSEYNTKVLRDIPYRFNSGLLMINLKQFRIENISLDTYSKYAKMSNAKRPTEETILNQVFKERTLFLNEYEYNHKVTTNHIYTKFKMYTPKIRVAHFEGNTRAAIVKPWDCYSEDKDYLYLAKGPSNDPLNIRISKLFSIWWKYAALSVFYPNLLFEMKMRKTFNDGAPSRMRKLLIEDSKKKDYELELLTDLLSNNDHENRLLDYIRHNQYSTIYYDKECILSYYLKSILPDKKVQLLKAEKVNVDELLLCFKENNTNITGNTIKEIITHNCLPKANASQYDEVVSLGFDCELSFVIRDFWYNGSINSFLYSWAAIEDEILFLESLYNMEQINSEGYYPENTMINMKKFHIRFHIRNSKILDEKNYSTSNQYLEQITELNSRIIHLTRKTKLLFSSNKRILFVVKYKKNDKIDSKDFIKNLNMVLNFSVNNKNYTILYVLEEKEYIMNSWVDLPDNIIVRHISKYSGYLVRNYNVLEWRKIIHEVDPTLIIKH